VFWAEKAAVEGQDLTSSHGLATSTQQPGACRCPSRVSVSLSSKWVQQHLPPGSQESLGSAGKLLVPVLAFLT
jgi:hypothetical protein